MANNYTANKRVFRGVLLMYDHPELVQTIPGSMFRLGVAGPEGCAPLHNGRFLPEEASLGVGIRVLTATMLAWMRASAAEAPSP